MCDDGRTDVIARCITVSITKPCKECAEISIASCVLHVDLIELSRGIVDL